MCEIAILGAGMAGFGAAHALLGQGHESIVYEKRSYHGGHTATYFHDTFIYDQGPHISFTKNERIQKLFAQSVNDKYEILQAKVNNYWQGYWLKHPAQCNLHGLPVELVVDIVDDFIQVQNSDQGEITTYKEWLYASFGKTFAENFPMRYGQKFHTTGAENMSTDWIGPRLYRPDLKEVLYGCLSPTTPDVHYANHFRYPSFGGFVSYLDLFAEHADLQLNHEVVRIDPVAKELAFANGKTGLYDFLVSSLPLPELIAMIKGVPRDVLAAAKKLACSQCVIVTVGIDRRELSEAHWSYFYDEDISFSRLSFPHMQSPNNAPPGTGSIQAEVYFSNKYKPLSVEAADCIEPVIEDLLKCGILKEKDKIIFADAKLIDYANIIFDLDRNKSLETVHGYLDELGIRYCGRYGKWEYIWTDESFVSGELASGSVLQEIG